MLDEAAGMVGTVAVQLVEAACCVLEGDRDTAKARIARAIALLQGELTAGPVIWHPIKKQSRPRGGLPSWQSRRVIAYIDAQLAGKIYIDALAQLVGLSAGHFSREFKRSFGMTAHAYVMQRRIEIAQGLMLTTHEPLSVIAASCGMSDQSHFSRSFSRLVGETPDSWRRLRRGVIAARMRMPEDRQGGISAAPSRS